MLEKRTAKVSGLKNFFQQRKINGKKSVWEEYWLKWYLSVRLETLS